MDQPTTTIYASALVPIRHGAWRQARLPLTVATSKGVLTTSGRSFGLQVSPTDPTPSVPAKLKVGTIVPVSVDVDIELATWSREQRELGIRPRRNLPWWVPLDRYLAAAVAVIDELAAHFKREALAAEAAASLRSAETVPAAPVDDEDLPLSA